MTMRAPSPAIDLRHIHIFLEMVRLKSASRTAEALDMTQPGVSIALARLRAHYGDPLFVRTGQQMLATERARLLAAPLHEAMRLLEEARTLTPGFDPASSTRAFTLALADAGRPVMLPRIADALQTAAPGVAVSVRNIEPDTPEALEDGRIDLAIGNMHQRKEGLMSQKLFADRFVCLASAASGPEALTRADYELLPHVGVDARVTATPLLNRLIDEQRIVRRVAVVVPNYFGLAEMIAGTSLLATVPRRMAEAMAQRYPVRILPLPFRSPSYDVSQHWHARLQHDEGHRWLRGVIAGLGRRLGPA